MPPSEQGRKAAQAVNTVAGIPKTRRSPRRIGRNSDTAHYFGADMKAGEKVKLKHKIYGFTMGKVYKVLAVPLSGELEILDDDGIQRRMRSHVFEVAKPRKKRVKK